MDTVVRAEMTVEDVLARWPETAVVFNEYNMACIGCAIAPFCTIGAAADYYGIAPEELLTRLNQAANLTN
jgi:hybrid cluster-associated redox disulfide protein